MRTQPRLIITIPRRGAGKPGTSQYMYLLGANWPLLGCDVLAMVAMGYQSLRCGRSIIVLRL
jgi:hypothetical protein